MGFYKTKSKLMKQAWTKTTVPLKDQHNFSFEHD